MDFVELLLLSCLNMFLVNCCAWSLLLNKPVKSIIYQNMFIADLAIGISFWFSSSLLFAVTQWEQITEILGDGDCRGKSGELLRSDSFFVKQCRNRVWHDVETDFGMTKAYNWWNWTWFMGKLLCLNLLCYGNFVDLVRDRKS